MIDFNTIQPGDKVKVVGMGAPGFAKLDDTLEITKVKSNRVWAIRPDGEEAFFALTCGAQRLELISEDQNPLG
jgi:hypothetical protein